MEKHLARERSERRPVDGDTQRIDMNQNRFFGRKNGRVISYDNAHDYHHRRYFGQVEPVDFVSFEDIQDQFARDWTALRSKP